MNSLDRFIPPHSAALLPSFAACHVALDKPSLLGRFLAAAMAIFGLAPSRVFAANQTWTNTGSVCGNWSETNIYFKQAPVSPLGDLLCGWGGDSQRGRLGALVPLISDLAPRPHPTHINSCLPDGF